MGNFWCDECACNHTPTSYGIIHGLPDEPKEHPMTPLSERLKARLAPYAPSSDGSVNTYDMGRADEHARTAPVVALLLEGIKLLEDIGAGKFKYYEDHTCEPYTQNYTDEIEQYMARLAAAIEGRG